MIGLNGEVAEAAIASEIPRIVTVPFDPQSAFVFHLDVDDNIERIAYISEEWAALLESASSSETPVSILIDRLRSRLVAPQHLYATILKWVRDRNREKTILFRWDHARWATMELTITPLSARRLELTGRPAREGREPAPTASVDNERRFATICACCRERMRSTSREWIGLEEVMQEVEFFLAVPPLILTHGFCPPCLEGLMREL